MRVISTHSQLHLLQTILAVVAHTTIMQMRGQVVVVVDMRHLEGLANLGMLQMAQAQDKAALSLVRKI